MRPADAIVQPYSVTPSALATDCMSLSPRPDKLTIMICSFDNCGASLIACATACELSSAGIIPSVSESSFNASSASASVTDVYSARPTSCSHECSGPTPG